MTAAPLPVSQFKYDPVDTLPEHQPWCVDAPPIRARMSIVDLTVDISEYSKPPPNVPDPPKARWGTLEFRVYTAVACVVLPIMAWIPISLSQPSNPNYWQFQGRLSHGWIPFRNVDNSDAQYRSFRSNFLLLTFLAALYLFCKFISTRLRTPSPPSANNLHLLPYNFVCALLFVLGLHGTSALKILAILSVNYLIARVCKASRAGPALTWVFNALVLFANDRYAGYRFGDVLPELGVLDSYQGAYKRWHIVFNLTMLRLVSFNMDFYWACNASDLQEYRHKRPMTHKERKASHPTQMYSFLNYVSYVLYPPLYIAGPIMTFNDYLWQHRRPIHIPLRTAIMYGLRLLVSLLTMELVLHFMYVVAIKDARAWTGNTPAQISMIGFWNLIIVWLKLLIPWRFFRLWALLDGLEAPENMVRCMANNYSTLGFWRSWHRSYNLWLIRYIYVPLGGSRRMLLNTALVFTFVALWHDRTFKLLAWGWLVSLFVLPEVVAATYILPASQYGGKWWYRHVCALGAVANILMMMGANLVGFVIGTDGVRFFVRELFGTAQGIVFFAAACACLFVGAQIMFEYREEEKRKGIYRRC
ncbi:putative membrane-bound acyltransferase family protein [Lyophyllum shimeji]|uniref:Membrane-bound acyltransferase family protein n=1 Tax=Lyophyllum shimeji TaxID=47721 RepID=A0A9P3UW41_LYOSH|nr:putative membrane-bound acyltransferase family protein [Lyophyllum shimeji]